MPWGFAAAAVGGALVSSYGANEAANTQADAANNAAGISKNEFDTITKQQAPFMQAGYGALSQLQNYLGISQPAQTTPNYGAPAGYSGYTGYNGNPNGMSVMGPNGPAMVGRGISPQPGRMQVPGGESPGGAQATGPGSPGFGSLTKSFTQQDFLNNLDPGYQWQLQQGQQGILNGAAAGSGALSGPALKSLMAFNQGMAATGYNDAFSRFNTQQNNIYSRLSGIANLGQNAAANTGQSGVALTGQMGQNIVGAGQATASGQVGIANAISGGLSNLAGSYLAYGGGNNNSPLNPNNGAVYGGNTVTGSDGYVQNMPGP